MDENPYKSPCDSATLGNSRLARGHIAMIVVLCFAWAVTLGGCRFAMSHASDRDSMQLGAAMFATAAFLISAGLTVPYALFLIVKLWR